ncbi:periplasmic heavy metal sensor [Shimia sp. SDUM112013]|uniref:periplasmic heavy metal sensor n=1 Tax=Shimia sp. SDUM112013 TaxID=3136160 RepID=UPI0032EE8021
MSDKSGAEKRKGRGRRILLILSLGLNILVLCVVVGAFIGFHRHGGDRHHAATYGPGAVYIRALEFDDKRALGKEIRRSYREAGAGRAEDHALLTRLVAAVRADPFDPESLRAVRQDLDARTAGRRAAAFETWLAFVAEMPPEERSAYADRMQAIMDKGPERDKN